MDVIMGDIPQDRSQTGGGCPKEARVTGVGVGYQISIGGRSFFAIPKPKFPFGQVVMHWYDSAKQTSGHWAVNLGPASGPPLV